MNWTRYRTLTGLGTKTGTIKSVLYMRPDNLEEHLGAFNEMFPRQTLVIWARATPEDLCTDDQV